MLEMKMETNEGGASFWVDKKWIVDASTLLIDGEIVIDTSKFDIEFDSREDRLTLQLK